MKETKMVYERLLSEGQPLTATEQDALKEALLDIENEIEELVKEKREIGRLLDYSKLLDNGFNKEEVAKFKEDDDKAIEKAEEDFKIHFEEDQGYMFGYPANMMEDSSVNKYFRWLESQMYFMNSCGDAYHPGNYRMNNAEAELAVIAEVRKNLKLDENKYWGYINSGGTEGNFWGLREGMEQYKDAKVYCSVDTHYSVIKFFSMHDQDKFVQIDSINGRIDTDKLFAEIEKNYQENNHPAILLLNLGTTALGSVDEVEKIKHWLVEKAIPHYIHLDSALYGGIPNNQDNSPSAEIIDKLNDLNIDSISVSLHKYVGSTRVNGILLAQEQSAGNFIDYIGQKDISILGSRDLTPFSTLQRVKELYSRTAPGEYYRNITIFEQLLKEYGIEYSKGDEKGNTFVIDAPCDEICKKYQLSTFEKDGKNAAHIIIFPYHSEEHMEELVKAIAKIEK